MTVDMDGSFSYICTNVFRPYGRIHSVTKKRYILDVHSDIVWIEEPTLKNKILIAAIPSYSKT